LTAEGERLATSLSAAFQQIARSVSRSIGRESEIIRLAICSSFGPGWLIDRVSDFHARHPETKLQLRMYAQYPLTVEISAYSIIHRATQG